MLLYWKIFIMVLLKMLLYKPPAVIHPLKHQCEFCYVHTQKLPLLRSHSILHSEICIQQFILMRIYGSQRSLPALNGIRRSPQSGFNVLKPLPPRDSNRQKTRVQISLLALSFFFFFTCKKRKRPPVPRFQSTKAML